MRRFAVLISIVVLFCFVSIALVPTFLSTTPGKNLLFRWLGARLHASIEAEKLSLSWFGKQQIEHLSLKGPLTLTSQKITIDSGLYNILRHRLNSVTLIEPSVTLANAAVQESPSSKGHAKKEKTQKERKPLSSIPFTGSLHVENGSVRMLQNEQEIITFQGISGDVALEKAASIRALLSGKTLQNAISGSFQIELDAKKSAFDLQAHFDRFPVQGVDRLIAFSNPHFDGLLQEGLGSFLDLNINASYNPSSLHFSGNLTSERAQAQFQGASQDQKFVLTAPLTAQLRLTPHFLEMLSKLFGIEGLSFDTASNFDLQMATLSIPYLEEKIDFSRAAVQSQWQLSPLEVTSTLAGSQIAFDKIEGSIQSAELNRELSIGFTTLAKVQDRTASLSLHTALEDVLSGKLRGKASLEAKEFPMAFVDQLFKLEGRLLLFTGNSLNSHLSLSKLDSAYQLSFDASSETLDLSEVRLQIDQGLSLMQPVHLRWQASQDVLQELKRAGYLNADSAPLIEVDLDHFSLPMTSSNLVLSGKLSSPSLRLAPYLPALEHFSAPFEVNTFENISVSLTADRFQATLSGAIQNGVFTLKTPLNAKYELIPEEMPKTAFSLVSPAVISAEIDTASIGSAAIKISGKVQIPQAALKGQQSDWHTSFENVNFPFQVDTTKEILSLSFQAQGEQGASWEGDAQIKNFDFEKRDFSKAGLQLNANLQNISVPFIEALINEEGRLASLVGPTLNLQLKMSHLPTAESLHVMMKSANLAFSAALEQKGNRLTIQGPLTLEGTLTPEGFAALDHWWSKESSEFFQLARPAHLKLSISRLQMPMSDTHFDLTAMNFAADAQLDNFACLENKTHQLVSLDNFSFKASKEEGSSPLLFALKSSIGTTLATSSAPSKEGLIDIQGKLDQFLTPQGAFDLSRLSSQIEAKIQKAPSTLFDLFARYAGITSSPFVSLFGEVLSAQFTTQLQNFTGPIALNVNSPNSRFSLVGQLANGILTLKEDLHAQVTLTPELSTFFLHQFNPLSLSSMTSNNPFTLQVIAKGFSLPLYPFDLSRFNLPTAHLELGQITCKNEGNIKFALSLLKQSKGGDLHLWFAPIDFHVNLGLIDVERTEILIDNSLEVASWGKIDLVNNYVDFILGLTAQCLKKAFGIDNLPPNYVLQIPMKGSMDNVEINTGKATAKIAALLVWQNKSLAGGGPAGAILGEVLGKLATLPDKDSKTPPAKHPFPWETKVPPPKAPKERKKKTKIKRREKPLKQLFKILR